MTFVRQTETAVAVVCRCWVALFAASLFPCVEAPAAEVVLTKGSTNEHWAFKAPVRPTIPPVSKKKWPLNEIDHFVLAKLEANKLVPSPEADRVTLIRRLCFDVTGLPPSPEEVDRFIADK